MQAFVAGIRSAMDPWDGSAALASFGNASCAFVPGIRSAMQVELSFPALARQWIHGMAPLPSLRLEM